MIALIHLMSTKDAYDKYIRFIHKHTVTKEVWMVLEDLRHWYIHNDTVEWPRFATWFKLVKHSTMGVDHMELFDKMFKSLETYEPEGTDEEIVEALITRDFATRIAEYTDEISHGKSGDLSPVVDLIEEYADTLGKASDVEGKFVTDDIDVLMDSVFAGGGYDWRLGELNLSLGPLRVGDFITVAARPDSGKTTLVASEITHITEQIPEDLYTLWFCNEEHGNKVKVRIIQAALGITTAEFNAHRYDYMAKYEVLMKGNRIKVVHDAGMHISDVEQVLKSYHGKTGLIVFDQLWQMDGFNKASNEVERQSKLFKWARTKSDIAPVINVHQAGGTAEGQLHFEMNHLYGSQTAIQGACDVVLCLGRSHDSMYSANTRGLYAPKNKLTGGPLSDSAYSNARFEVEIQPDIARYIGIL